MVRHPLSRRHVLHTLGAAAVLSALPRGAFAASETPPALDIYGRLPAVGKCALSPDGKRAAVAVSNNGEMAVNDIDLATGEIVSLPIEQANAIPVLFWADNETVFVIASQSGATAADRYEIWTGYLAAIRGGKRYRLYQDMAEYGANLAGDFHRFQRDGVYYVTASNFRVTAANYTIDASTGLYAFTLGDHRTLHLDEDTRHVIEWAIDGSGQVIARSEYDDRRRLWRLRYKGADGWRVIWQMEGDLDLPALKGVGRDGKSVVLAMGEGELRDCYVEMDENGHFGEKLVDNRSRYTPMFSPVTGRLTGFASDVSLNDYIFYDDVSAHLPGLVAAALGSSVHADIVDVAENPLQVIVSAEAPGRPASLFACDFTTGSVRALGETYPDLPLAWAAPKRRVTYAASDGLEIEAFVTMPVRAAAKACPTVVLVHGGPESYDDDHFDWMAQALASRGYLVFQPNFRGSSGYGIDFMAKGYGEWGRRMQSDVSDGVAWLVAQGLTDPKRVAIAGASYGGYAALAGVALQHGIYTCAIAMSGTTDPKRFMTETLQTAHFKAKAHSVLYWQRYFGDAGGWDAISPLVHAADVDAPVLLIHGRDDAVVSIEESYAMRDALLHAGKPVEMVLLKDEDHYLSKEATRIQALTSVTDFLARHNPV